MVGDAMAGLNGAPVVLLTSTVTSPTTKQVISEFLAKYPEANMYSMMPFHTAACCRPMKASFGSRAIPSYNFQAARVIVSFGADFLGTWLSPVEFARGYSYGRKIDEKNPVDEQTLPV
jgi:molybdopterin-containing oxidoreductase family iron-sulfur binding subunit